MSGREKKEEETPREGNQGICIKCRRLLPAASFMRDVTGCLTAWCSVCREEVARNWTVDADMVEFARALYVFEQTLKREAETVMRAQVNLGQAIPEDFTALQNRLHHHHMIRHSRIRDRMRRILTEYRESFYGAVGMEDPAALVPMSMAPTGT